MSGAKNRETNSAQQFCADLVRARDFPNYAASLFVAPEPRRAHLALAAFNAEVSHVRDHVSQPMPGEIRLQWWRDALTGAGSTDGIEGNPVAAELQHAIKTYDLPVEMLVRLIDAHVFDVYDDPMPDMAALEAHGRDTSAALFKLRAKILGADISAVERVADHAGVAEGLADVMLSLPKHAARRQLYLPADLINLKNANIEEIFLRQSSPQLKDVLAHLHREAQKQIDVVLATLDDVPPQARIAFLSVAVLCKTLDKLGRAEPFDPPQMSRLSTLWTLWRASGDKPFKA